MVLFHIHCTGVQGLIYENCVNVQMLLDQTVYGGNTDILKKQLLHINDHTQLLKIQQCPHYMGALMFFMVGQRTEATMLDLYPDASYKFAFPWAPLIRTPSDHHWPR